jgi:hypothetical protein
MIQRYRIHELTGNKFGIAEVELRKRHSVFGTAEYLQKQQRYISKGLALAQEINARVLGNCML